MEGSSLRQGEDLSIHTCKPECSQNTGAHPALKLPEQEIQISSIGSSTFTCNVSFCEKIAEILMLSISYTRVSPGDQWKLWTS